MINFISVSSYIEQNDKNKKYVLLPFFKNGKEIDYKKWGMTVLKGQSMRFRWNEKNFVRDELLKSIVHDGRQIVPLELIHSQKVYKLLEPFDTQNLQGDGMITDNNLLIPTVTVADCVPIYFCDEFKRVFGVVHSGWKGTGIIENALKIAVEDYGCEIKNICVAIGPHINECCYYVDEQRADYFIKNFTKDCIEEFYENGEKKYRLSLTKANVFVLKKFGILGENITIAKDCTCCTKFSDGDYVFGSFRRQAAFLPKEIDNETRSKSMTVQAAFVM